MDLAAVVDQGLLTGQPAELARIASLEELNSFFALGRGPVRTLRYALFDLLLEQGANTNNASRFQEKILYPLSQCEVLLPLRVTGFTDFYAGINHARNVGSLLRPDNPLLPNYKHLPIAYNGRASSVRASGHSFRRPSGQTKSADAELPAFGPSRRVDFELELGIWIGRETALGEPVPIDQALDLVAGVCLLNDWSARDIQAWEYVPLGPFLAKTFGSVVSPWVVTMDALAPLMGPTKPRSTDDPPLQPYLDSKTDRATGGLDIGLSVYIQSARMREAGIDPTLLGESSSSHLYWSIAQMIAHHTVNGCNLVPGDLLGSGTISGETRRTLGSLMEMSSGGKEPITLTTGERRTFLENGDRIEFRGRAEAAGYRPIGFGACVGEIIA
jgi:fumarylacetoacetase